MNSNNLSEIKSILFDLCSLSGVSGDEREVSKYCAEYLSNYAEENVEIDEFNNVVAVFGNENADKTILLDAHIDRIGFIVRNIDDNGFISVDKVGGVDLRTALDAPVIVHGKENLNGIICCMPPHLSDGKEDTAAEIDKIHIDLGLPVKRVKELVNLGDGVSFKAKPVELLNNRVTASALDNRAGVCALLRTAAIIGSKNNQNKKPLPFKVVILLSCQEETFAFGAKTKSFDIAPDEAICVDVSFSNQPSVSGQYSKIKLGKGPMLCITPNLDRDMYNRIVSVAEKLEYEYQTEIAAGTTGTNADYIAVSRSGVKTAVISVPQKNMHTQAEIVDLNDINETGKLIAAYLRHFSECGENDYE